MKITNGEITIEISKGSYNEHYKGSGWQIVKAAPSDGEGDGKDKNKRDLTEIPLSEMTLPELKKYAKLKNIDISKVTKMEDILKTIQEAKPAEVPTGKEAGDGGSQ